MYSLFVCDHVGMHRFGFVVWFWRVYVFVGSLSMFVLVCVSKDGVGVSLLLIAFFISW